MINVILSFWQGHHPLAFNSLLKSLNIFRYIIVYYNLVLSKVIASDVGQ